MRLFYALLYTINRDSNAVIVIRALFVRMDMWAYVPRGASWLNIMK